MDASELEFSHSSVEKICIKVYGGESISNAFKEAAKFVLDTGITLEIEVNSNVHTINFAKLIDFLSRKGS